jgi:hypothetical protein
MVAKLVSKFVFRNSMMVYCYILPPPDGGILNWFPLTLPSPPGEREYTVNFREVLSHFSGASYNLTKVS